MEQQSIGLSGGENSTTVHQTAESERDGPVEFSLPRADGGMQAWLLLAGAFTVEGLCWGWAYSYGIFQEFYTKLELFEGQQAQVPLVGTISTGIMFLCSPIALPLLRMYAYRRRQIMVAGLCLTSIAWMSASFATKVTHLIVTQGVLGGIGSSMIYYPVFLFIDEWFVRRKGLAYGLMWAASGLFGLVLPYLISWSLEHYSFRTTLRMWTAVNLAVLCPAFIVVKPRLPHSTTAGQYRLRLSFAKNPYFVIFCAASTIEALGHYLPGIYLPSYANAIGLGNTVGTTTVAILNIGTFLGSVFGGFLTDHWSSSSIISSSTVCMTLTILFIWGFSANSGSLTSFAFLYAFFGASYVAVWPGVIKEIIRRDTTQSIDPSSIYAFFIAARGIGNIACGPLSQALLQLPRLTKNLEYGYGSGYGWMILFAGAAVAQGGLTSFLEGMGWLDIAG